MKLSKEITELIINRVLSNGGGLLGDMIEQIEHDDCPVELLEFAFKIKHRYLPATIAGHPNTPIHILSKLVRSDDWNVRRDAVKNPNLPSDLLLQLACDGDYDVIKAITRNPNVTVEILEKISRKQSVDCKEMVAQHELTPVRVLERLSRSEGNYVRRYIACNPNTPIETLRKLYKDKSQSVRCDVLRNPNVPFELILNYRSIMGNSYYTDYMLKHKDCPAEILEAMHMDLDFNMRALIAVHPNTPLKILEKYARYKSHGQQSRVQDNSKCPAALKMVLTDYIDRDNLIDLINTYKRGGKATDIKNFVEIENTFEDLLN